MIFENPVFTSQKDAVFIVKVIWLRKWIAVYCEHCFCGWEAEFSLGVKAGSVYVK